VHVMYPRGGRSSPKVRLFADFVSALFDDVRGGASTGTPLRRAERWPMYRNGGTTGSSL
jgi:hypothetical protein